MKEETRQQINFWLWTIAIVIIVIFVLFMWIFHPNEGSPCTGLGWGIDASECGYWLDEGKE